MCLISQEVVEDLILDRTQLISGCVVLSTDFADIAEDRLIRSALESLAKNEKLAQIGEVVFAKVRLNRITGDVMLDSDGGFDCVAKEALTRLGITWESSSAENAYRRGEKHVPARCVVRVLKGDPPSLSYKGHRLLYENWL